MSLQSLLDPVSGGEFFKSSFETRPLHVDRSRPSHFHSLLTLDGFDRVLGSLDIRHPDIRLVDARREIESAEYVGGDGRIELTSLYRMHHEGATVILNRLDAFEPGLAEFCAALEMEFSAPSQVNAYLTPPGAQGFKPHFDTHDVFVVQAHGSKRWRLYGAPIPLPLANQDEDVDAHALGAPAMEFTLREGDTLYIPRGHVHDAVSLDSTSLHLSVGVLAYTWADLLLEAVAGTVLADAGFRRALPTDLAKEGADHARLRAGLDALAGRLRERMDAGAAIQSFVDDLLARRRPRLAGQLRLLAAAGEIGIDSQLRRRGSLLYSIDRRPEALTLRCFGNAIEMPAAAAPALEHALRSERFRVSELPGLDDAEKLVLVRRLVREGLLVFA